jgi:hypothetical protein
MVIFFKSVEATTVFTSVNKPGNKLKSFSRLIHAAQTILTMFYDLR